MRASYDRAIPRAWQRTAGIFTALGDAHRQRILLMFEPGEALTATQIVDAAPLSRTAVVHHLRVLRDAGVLRARKAGREVWYTPDPDAVRAGLAAVLDYLAAHLPGEVANEARDPAALRMGALPSRPHPRSRSHPRA